METTSKFGKAAWANFNKKVFAGMEDVILDCLGDKSINSIQVASMGVAFAATVLANETGASPEQRVEILKQMVIAAAPVSR